MRPTGHEFSDETLMALLRALRARVASHPESPGMVAWLPAVREDRMSAACAELLRRGHTVSRAWMPGDRPGSRCVAWSVATPAPVAPAARPYGRLV
jgi:hypothetical protein